MNLPTIYLLDRSRSMVEAWKYEFREAAGVFPVADEFSWFMEQHGDVDCVVSPANSYGIMDGGYDLAITRYFGEELQECVQEKIVEDCFGEQPVGTSLSVEYEGWTIIHTPTMRVPSRIVDSMVVYHAMRSTLIEAVRCNVECMVIPAFGAGCGMLAFTTVAELMAAAYFQLLNPPDHIDWEYACSRRLIDGNRL